MRERRLRLSKIGNVGLWTAVILGLLVVGGSSISRKIIAWLESQPAYSLAFRDIELDPAPPRWIKSGRVGLLEQVRAGRPNLAKFSAAQLDLDNLTIDFKKLAWVSSVVLATKSYPNKVSVSLTYREPVARLLTSKGTFIIDADTVVLPDDDIDLDKTGRLFEIAAEAPREAPRPGIAWPGDLKEPTDAKLNPYIRVALAAKLAGFLKTQTADLNSDATPSYLPLKIFADREKDLLMRLTNSVYVLWSDLPINPATTEPTDEQKWAWLIDQSKTENGLAMKSREFLDLSGEVPRIGRFGPEDNKKTPH